ncbi:hypothetical protein [Leptospira sp. GIMC2001]|uniref:hypothetical protein n=1 Tax=Leptospira sp. GIMC2001 TaxID=1513297 RepID=UPI0023491783|nr:hypothetical protein [Leptospira sp. GIMC2001]WCL49098.1 hypothetical protein O4O04_17680 [Leptospira sp. GIMC2001]
MALLSVYYDSASRIVYPGVVFILAYLQSVFLEWGNQSSPNFTISLLQLILSIGLVCISFFYKKNLSVSIIGIHIVMIGIALLEIESGFHDPEFSFNDARNWLAIIALLGVWSFTYPGKVSRFVLIWTAILLYYLIRIIIEHDMTLPINTLKDMSTIFPLFVFFFFINNWWFGMGYLAAYRGILLEEKNLNFLRDIHDNVGSQLTDLSLYCKQLKEKDGISSDKIIKIQIYADKALANLRRQVHERDEEEILKKSFLDGIRIILLRRYSESGRNVRFQIDENSKSKLSAPFISEFVDDLKSVVNEISSNDLRYGSGSTIWRFASNQNSVDLVVFSKTMENMLREVSGIGEKNIISRLNKYKASYNKKTTSDSNLDNPDYDFTIRISLPLSSDLYIKESVNSQ